MKALLCRQLGPPESLSLVDLPEPAPQRGEVLVRVAYAALNFMDLLIVAGKYQVKPALPFSPSAEFAGTVAALGEGVQGFQLGDRVAGFSGHGAARETVLMAADRLFALPAGVSLAQAAGLPIAYGTTLHALRQRAGLKAGESLAVLGASGGVGLAAVEVGVAMGARVIACASTDDRLALAKAHGAADAVNYTRDNLRDELKRLTGGVGVDVVYDPVGGVLSEPALRALAWKGRLLAIGFASGEIPRIPLNLVLLKGCDIRGVFFGDFANREPEVVGENMRTLLDWALQKRIAQHPPTIFAIENFREAFTLLKGRRGQGKVLLQLGAGAAGRSARPPPPA